MIRLVTIQILMFIIAVASGIGCAVLGTESATGGFDISYNNSTNAGLTRNAVTETVDAGYDGGAVGLGVISGLCFIGFVWIEITKFKAQK